MADKVPVWQAVALGALHGPAELLPISSSGHVALVPWLLGWDYDQLDDELRKAFEVALHAGTAAALLITLRGEVDDARARARTRGACCMIALSFAPPAVDRLPLERRIEGQLGTPPTVAAGLFGGRSRWRWPTDRPRSAPTQTRDRSTRCGSASRRRAR